MLRRDLSFLRPHSILILSLSAIFLFVGGFFALQGVSRWWGSTAKKNTPSVRVVELRDDGFYPPTISISPGDTIHFTTTRTEPFWPASNLHPTHALYPEFDPKKPVSPTASWTFTFSKPGSWEYHDHLAPLYRGVITVGNEQEKQGCDGGENTLCSQEEIGAALTAGGVSAAFDVVASLYTRQSFSGDCHGYAHEIGEAAYFLYEGGKDMRLSPKTSYCGYGFYHGFMETLLHERGSAEEARDFCRAVGSELEKETTDAEGACYHGIGHGAVDGSDPRAWGDVRKLIEPAMDLCKAVADERDTEIGSYFYRCITGVYNALEVLSADHRYGISFLRENPFAFCATEPTGYQEPCYTNMIPVLLASGGGDFGAMARRVEAIEEKDDDFSIRFMAISALFHEFTRAHLAGQKDIGEGILACRSLERRAHRACIDGLSGGFMKYGEPKKEYVKGLAFCDSSGLLLGEKNICLEHILSRLRIWYAPPEAERICASVGEPYRRYCRL